MDGKRELVETAFTTIREGLEQFVLAQSDIVPSQADQEELDELAVCCMRERVSGWFGAMAIEVARDGFALHKSTRAGLVDESHTLKVPTDDGAQASYHRQSYNVDAQCIPRPPAALHGYGEISCDDESVVEVLSFERDVIRGSITNWSQYRPYSENIAERR